MNNNIKYGIVGVGHLGRLHVEQIQKIPNVTLSGVFDANLTVAKEIAAKHNTIAFKKLKKLLSVSDAVSIVVPTPFHHSVAMEALQMNCHIFIEKPITNNIKDAKEILSYAKKINKKIQVGHIEQFNPVYQAFILKNHQPLFIESHRLAPFNIRGSDVPVVLDLMIHDIDLIISLMSEKIVNIQAAGASVISKHIDLANARIEFKDGAIANLTASRIATKQMRQMRVFEKNYYSALDFQEQTLKVLKVDSKKQIITKNIPVFSKNALFLELESFIHSITNNYKTKVDGEQGLLALDVAMKIQRIIEKQPNI